MDNDASNIVRVSFKGCDLLRGVIVVNSQLEVIGAADDPVLSRNEATSANRDIGELEGFDNGLGVLILVQHIGKVWLTCVSYDQM